jgi:hypothetical protein
MIEEVNTTFDPQSGYFCPNERIRIFLRRIARLKLRPKKVLSICSGGEVPILCFLPIAEEVLAIDHSRMSLATAATKIKILRERGLAGWEELLRSNKFLETWRQLSKDLMPTRGYYATGIQHYGLTELKCVWADTPKVIQHRAVAHLDRLKLLHGDLLDMADRGPFDAMYVSNAMEHTGRNGKPSAEKLLSLLAPGGVIFYTRQQGYGSMPYTGPFPGCQLLAKGPGLAPGFTTQWQYEMARKPA